MKITDSRDGDILIEPGSQFVINGGAAREGRQGR